jgi:hypothetical protein
MGSFDVVSFFTTTLVETALQRTRKLLEEDSNLCESTSHSVGQIDDDHSVCI